MSAKTAPKQVTVITTQGLTYTTPVLDETGKPLTEKVKHNGREVDSPIVNRHEHGANEAITVNAKFAKELIEEGLARAADAALDDVDPTKPGDQKNDDALA